MKNITLSYFAFKMGSEILFYFIELDENVKENKTLTLICSVLWKLINSSFSKFFVDLEIISKWKKQILFVGEKNSKKIIQKTILKNSVIGEYNPPDIF